MIANVTPKTINSATDYRGDYRCRRELMSQNNKQAMDYKRVLVFQQEKQVKYNLEVQALTVLHFSLS